MDKEQSVMLDGFIKYMQEKRYKEKTTALKKTGVKAFFSYLNANNIKIHSLKKEEAILYIKLMQKRGVLKNSIMAELSILKLFFRYVKEKNNADIVNHFTTYNKMLGLKKEEKKQLPQSLCRYITHLKSIGRSESTIRLAKITLIPFFDFMKEKGMNEINAIQKGDIQHYLEYIYSELNYSAKYRSNIIYFIKDYFKNAFEMNILYTNPTLKIRSPKLEKLLPKDIPTDKEVKEIIRYIPKEEARDRAIIEILYGSGLRASELVCLKLDDVDYEKMTLRVTDKKNKTERIVPFNEITGYTLKEYTGFARERHIKCISGRSKIHDEERAKKESAEYLFLSNGGMVLSKEMVRIIVKKHVRNANIKKNFTPHSLRHACASEMLKGGAGIRWIQKMLGHEDINTTMIYTKIGIEDLKKIVDRMHPHGSNNPDADLDKKGGKNES